MRAFNKNGPKVLGKEWNIDKIDLSEERKKELSRIGRQNSKIVVEQKTLQEDDKSG